MQVSRAFCGIVSIAVLASPVQAQTPAPQEQKPSMEELLQRINMLQRRAAVEHERCGPTTNSRGGHSGSASARSDGKSVRRGGPGRFAFNLNQSFVRQPQMASVMDMNSPVRSSR
jgi:hypothetical protein